MWSVSSCHSSPVKEDVAKPELTGITHEYLSCLWFAFFYFIPHNIAADQISDGDGGVGTKKVKTNSRQNQISD